MSAPEQHFTSAADFLQALRPSADAWRPSKGVQSPWVFRGHASSKWLLLPALWREGQTRDEDPFWKAAEADATNLLQRSRTLTPDADRTKRARVVIQSRYAESRGTRLFCQIADEIGLQTGAVGEVSLSELDFMLQGLFDSTISRDASEAIAMAQHHGIATRLLDWTRRPLVAAYFSAIDSLTQSSEGPILAVWAINSDAVTTNFHDCQIISVPRSRNNYLHAQDGLFTFDRNAGSLYCASSKWPCLGDRIREKCGPDAVRKLMLPHTEANDLIKLLRLEGISEAHLKPSLDSVANTAKFTQDLE